MMEDWKLLLSYLPENWKELARRSGALRGLRQEKTEEGCLRVLLMHVGCGWSLRETVVHAESAGIAAMSDVALLKRLRKSADWLRLLCEGLLAQCPVSEESAQTQQAAAPRQERRQFRLIDATVVEEPGKTGSTWRVHYSFQWPRLECEYVTVTPQKGKDTGEHLRRHPLQRGDLVLADRGYCHATGFAHAAACGAFVTVRLNPRGIRLESAPGQVLDLAHNLRTLRGVGQVGEWPVQIPQPEGAPPVAARLCVVRKSETAALQAQRKLKTRASKNGYKVQDDSILCSHYIMVLTTFPAEEFDAATVLQDYRCRWQIELLFKRLKHLMQLGHLPKRDPTSSRAWLYGKLLLALLTERIIQAARAFSPWGYDLPALHSTSLRPATPSPSQPMA